MNTVRRVITVAALAALALPALAQDVRAGVIKTLQSYESALARGDAAAIAQLYTTDGVQMAPDYPAAVGREGVKAAYEGTFKAVALDLKFTADEIKPLGSDTALLRSHSTGTFKVKGIDKPAAPASFKELFLLRKQQDGNWLFTHYSFSASAK